MSGSRRSKDRVSVGVGRMPRLLMGVLATAVLIALTALPGYSATAKVYTLVVTPSQAISGQSTDFFVTMTNKSPGNSNPNSFSVTAPEGFSVAAASISTATNPNASAHVVVVGSKVNVTSLDPVKTGQFVTLKITGTPPSPASGCSAIGTWSATVWTGSSLSGDTFALNNPGSAQQTTVYAASCLTLQFVQAPTNGVINTPEDVKVGVYLNGSPVAFSTQITIVPVSAPAGATLSGAGPIATNPSTGVADFPSFAGDTTGDYAVKATSAPLQDSSSASFTLFAGTLNCGDTVTQDGISLTRGPNADLTSCQLIDYTLSRGTGSVTFLKDLTQQTSATFTMSIVWDPETAVYPTNQTTQVDFGTGLHPVQWCDGTSTAPVLPGDEKVCLTSESAAVFSDTQIQVTSNLYIQGDLIIKH